MKTDTTYSCINVCPTTETTMSDDDVNHSDGVCPHCGDVSVYSYAHSKKVAGRWVRPSLCERIFKGKKSSFLRKDEEDKIMDTLRK